MKMIKKAILTLFIFSMIISCGKKGDPVFNDQKNKAKYHNTLVNKI